MQLDFKMGYYQILVCTPDHPDAEIRVKALKHLQSDMDTNMLDLTTSSTNTKLLLRSLLEWFNLPIVSHESLVINFLIKLAQVRIWFMHFTLLLHKTYSSQEKF